MFDVTNQYKTCSVPFKLSKYSIYAMPITYSIPLFYIVLPVCIYINRSFCTIICILTILWTCNISQLRLSNMLPKCELFFQIARAEHNTHSQRKIVPIKRNIHTSNFPHIWHFPFFYKFQKRRYCAILTFNDFPFTGYRIFDKMVKQQDSCSYCLKTFYSHMYYDNRTMRSSVTN